MIAGFESRYNQEQAAKRLVLTEMTRDREFNNLMEFPKYLSWKSTYYDNDGQIIRRSLSCFHRCMENGKSQQFHPPLNPLLKRNLFHSNGLD